MSKSGSQGKDSVGASQRDVNNYAQPTGRAASHIGVGLGGHNCGIAGTQGGYATRGDGQSGKPGLGGDNCGNDGSQEDQGD